jgi:hypothetical protein
LININANIPNASVDTLNGKIKSTILKGVLNNKIVNQAFDLKLNKAVSFNGEVNTSLIPNTLVSNSTLNTSLANIMTKSTTVNLISDALTSDYEINVTDLNNLYDLTNTKLRGKLKLNGNIKQDKNLKIIGKTSILGGEVMFTLINDDLVSNAQSIQTKELLYMMYYPVIFDSVAKSDVKYNLKSQKGTVLTILENGKILPNKYTNTIKNLTKFDLTREAYTDSTIKSTINKKVIKSTVDMNSKNTEIDVPNSTIDLNKRTIIALVQTRLDNIEFDTNISGNLDKPKVKIQTDKLIKSTVKTKLYKQVEEKINNKLGGDAVKSLLKGLFK